MVEPQEPSILDDLLLKQQRFTMTALEDGRKLPTQMVAAAEKKLQGYKALKGELDQEMVHVHQSLENVCKKIKENVWSPEHTDGFLTRKQDDYLQCLEIGYGKLEQLLREDETRWAQNLVMKQQKANQVNENLQRILQENQSRLETLLNSSMRMFSEIELPKSKFILKRLPMWGIQVSPIDINFTWPTQELLDRWPSDIYLETISFSTWGQGGSALSSVQCTLSNGESSPLFDTNGRGHYHRKTIYFQPERPTKSVQSRAFANYARRVTFLDENEQEIDSFNPKNEQREGQIMTLDYNEELLGVYGVRNKESFDHFTSFGFIVGVKQF